MLSFPLEAHAEYTNFDILENLSVDFWKHMVLKDGKYTPTSFLSNLSLTFRQKEAYV